jgi:hypothetical protein
MARALLLTLCGLAALLLAPARSFAQEAAAARVAVRGQVAAKLKGEALQFRFLENPGDLDGSRYFEILLTDSKAPDQGPVVRGKTDSDGNFALRSVRPGSYIAEVRIPTVAEGQDLGILYRGKVEIKADQPKQELNLPVSFLYIRVQDAQGKAFAWNTLKLGIHRTGGELDQRWGQVVFSRGGLEGPNGPQQAEPGTIQVRLQKGGFSFSWGSKEMGAVIFPVVEEDRDVRYRMSFSVPGMGGKVHRFAAARGKSPEEVDCPLQPMSILAGKLKLQGLTADLQGTSLALSVLDPEAADEDDRPLHYASAAVGADGSFRFNDVPPGLAQISAEVVGKADKQAAVRGVAREWLPVNEHENRLDLALQVAARSFVDPAPGDIFVSVVDGLERKPVGRIKVQLLAGESQKGMTSVTGPDGRCVFMLRRPRSYKLRVTELLGGEKVIAEVPITEAEVRQGVRKEIKLGGKANVASLR